MGKIQTNGRPSDPTRVFKALRSQAIGCKANSVSFIVFIGLCPVIFVFCFWFFLFLSSFPNSRGAEREREREAWALYLCSPCIIMQYAWGVVVSVGTEKLCLFCEG